MIHKKDRSKVLAVLLVLLANTVLFAQSIYDDIMNNDLDALKTKVDLLNPNLKDAPYLADYLSQGEQYDSAVFDYLLSKGADPD
ncbi:MAG TPA: hypothetical protein PLE05_08270, partial [Bacillota bacterium]|nr:hypothetical protein [Bacillota bacterium]